MTFQEIRAAQLDELKSGFTRAIYILRIEDQDCKVIKNLSFPTLQELEETEKERRKQYDGKNYNYLKYAQFSID